MTKRRKPPRPPKKLSARAERFARCYRGSGVQAAREAGYGGSNAVLAVMANKLLRLPGVQAILAERRDASTPDEVSDEDTSDANIRFLTALRDDETALATARIRASEALVRIENARKPADYAPIERLAAKVQQLLREKRARERGDDE